MEYDFSFAGSESLAKSRKDGIVDDKYFLWVPEWLQDAEEKEYLVLLNTGGRIEKEFKVVYHFKAEYIRNKSCFALSQDGKTAVIGYATKKGVICYDCEQGIELWNNPKIKKIHKIRFNNFNPDIIEVLSDKLEFTYLDKRTGQVLDADEAKRVRQVINWMRASKNGRYLMTADTLSDKDKANYTVYDTETREIKGRFVAQSQLNPQTFDVTDDGEFAVCSSYQRQGISMIRVATGEVLWTQKKTKEIHKVYIDKAKEQVVVCCRYDGVYFLDIKSGEVADYKRGEKVYLNTYGEDIWFPRNNIAKIGGKRIESPTSSWLSAVGSSEGVLLQPTGRDGLMLYDYDGNLLWKNKEIIGEVAYQEKEKLICAFVSVEHVEKIMIASVQDGQIIASTDVPDYACAFINQNKTIVCNTGKMYDVSNGCIKEIEEPLAFLVG